VDESEVDDQADDEEEEGEEGAVGEKKEKKEKEGEKAEAAGAAATPAKEGEEKEGEGKEKDGKKKEEGKQVLPLGAKNRGFGFVNFVEHESAKKAMEEMNGKKVGAFLEEGGREGGREGGEEVCCIYGVYVLSLPLCVFLPRSSSACRMCFAHCTHPPFLPPLSLPPFPSFSSPRPALPRRTRRCTSDVCRRRRSVKRSCVTSTLSSRRSD